MASTDNQNNSFFEKLKDTYRLVVLDDETLQEVRSYKLSLLNLYLFFSSIIVLTAILILCLFFFTPLKRLVPGYGDINDHPKFIELNKQFSNLEKELDIQEEYINGFKKMLSDGNKSPEIENILSQKHNEHQGHSHDNAEKTPENLNNKEIGMTINQPADLNLKHFHFTIPLKGSISAGYEAENKHFGVDILAPKNSPIKSITDGVVINSDWNLETGNTIAIQHKNNLITVFKHNSVLLKNEGDFVKSGEAIAIIGNSGTLSDGPHMHFELWYDGRPLNPQEFFNFEG